MRLRGLALPSAIPRHLSQEHTHGAEIGETCEGQSQADEARETEPKRMERHAQSGAEDHQEAGGQANLALERPARPYMHDQREAGFGPSARATFEHRYVLPALFEQASS